MTQTAKPKFDFEFDWNEIVKIDPKTSLPNTNSALNFGILIVLWIMLFIWLIFAVKILIYIFLIVYISSWIYNKFIKKTKK